MARLAATEFAADWIIHADADEFFWTDTRSLRDVLAAVPAEYGVLVAPVYHFRPRPDESGSYLNRLVVREAHSRKPLGDLTVVRVLHRAHPKAIVGPANKSVSGSDLRVMPGWHPVEVLHFPMRSWAQYERKIVEGGRPFKPWSWDENVVGGELRAFYATHLLEDDVLRDGIRSGALVWDERLLRYMTALRAGVPAPAPVRGTGGGSLAWPDLPPKIAELRAEAQVAAYRSEHAPPAADLRDLRRRVESWRAKAEHWRTLAHSAEARRNESSEAALSELRRQVESWRAKTDHWRALARQLRAELDSREPVGPRKKH
jgi:hypothetical protein